jgi:hypothetical protein
MKIKVESAYEDGYESTRIIDVDDPGLEAGEELEEYLSDWNGDGHGEENPRLGYCYTITILEADNPALVRHEMEWCGR